MSQERDVSVLNLLRVIRKTISREIFYKLMMKMVYPLSCFFLKSTFLRNFVTRFYVGDFCLWFRPFIYSDLAMLFDWESDVNRVLSLGVKKGDVVFDVGAYIGYYSLKCAKNVEEDGLVLAFEPDPENIRILKKNTRIFKNVKLFNVALGKNDGERFFYMDVIPSRSSLLHARAHSDVRQRKKVQVRTLDGIVEKLKITHIDWIKIDVERGEFDVLEGGKKTFTNLVDKVIIETTNEKVLNFLSKRRFEINRLHGPCYFCIKK